MIFQFNAFETEIKSFEDYLRQVNHTIRLFGKLPNFHAYYATNELPIFLYLFYPRLLCLKLYVYAITVWNITSFKKVKFSFNLLSPKSIEIARQTAEMYTKIYSRDVWTLDIIDNTLQQISYLVEIGKFSTNEDLRLILEDLNSLIEHTSLMAEFGTKFSPRTTPLPQMHTLDLFINEFSTTNNTILGISDQTKVLISTFQHPNFLLSTDERLCLKSESWFKELINNSTNISKSAGPKRIKYFNKLREKINFTKKMIELNNQISIDSI